MIREAPDTRREPLRLLFVVPFSPRFDTTHGGRVVAQLIVRLAERHRVAIVYLRRPRTAPIEPGLAATCEFVEEVALRPGRVGGSWRHRLNVISAPLTGIPSAAAALRDPRTAETCATVAAAWRPHVIQVEHDTIADLGRRLRRSGVSTPLVLVCHDPGPQTAEDQARVTRGRQRLAHRMDAVVWRRYWRRTLPAYDAIVTFSDADREAIATAAPAVRAETIGLGTDIPAAPLSPSGHGEPTVAFVGGYLHPPNTDAAMRLLTAIMPTVRRRLPGLKLALVGADPGPALRDAAGPDDTVTGRVPRVIPFLNQAALLAMPLRLGGGMRVKLLEGLAAGKAIVASPLAAAGLEVADGRELVLADTDAEFADAIVRLLTDAEARIELAQNARRWALDHLSWDSRVEAYEDLYRSLLSAAA